ncbi:hypothetical protein G7Y89_g15733 [Cudoniella acicularis]|uniref:Amidohydrolase-related domain-containing protein n=1 Tax=Cudoniella acicularis TaxID=354080 RepID=A0A8H4QFW6_9HELO|nr:hypothetical protein G7Y89_g15733 [Cudoniella acicularis]
MATKTILLQGGTILTHDQNDHVHPLKADILIEGDLISKIEANITPPAGTQVIGCKNKIISPGFIDTHHHVWQTLLKGRHANELLLEYFYTGNLMNSMHNPEEIFWGQLGGALECLDAGTTTVVDHAHLNYSPEHSKAALAATISSGIRSIFGYCPTPRVQTWKPFTLNPNLLEDWVLTTMDELASKSPFGDGRVQIGLAFDGLFLPKEYVVALFERAKAKGIKTITSHFARTPISPTNTLQILHSYGLLDKSIIISHGSNLTAEDATVLLSSGATISSTPSTEMQMLGFPVPFYPATSPSIHSNCSLGIDCHSATSASIPSEMKLLLQGSRAAYNQLFIDQGKVPKKVNIEVEEVFNLGTIKGARAVGMEEEIGSLAVGKRADIVVFDGGIR